MVGYLYIEKDTCSTGGVGTQWIPLKENSKNFDALPGKIALTGLSTQTGFGSAGCAGWAEGKQTLQLCGAVRCG